MTQKSPASPSKLRGFTIIELLVVMAIIVILAGMTISGIGQVRKNVAVKKAKTQLALLQAELENYQADHGLPSKDDRCGLIVYTMLFGDGVGLDGEACTGDDGAPDGRPDEGATIYLAELDPKANSFQLVDPSGQDATPRKLLDPFGQPWRFRSGALASMNPKFDLWSAGPDGQDDTADDIRNW